MKCYDLLDAVGSDPLPSNNSQYAVDQPFQQVEVLLEEGLHLLILVALLVQLPDAVGIGARWSRTPSEVSEVILPGTPKGLVKQYKFELPVFIECMGNPIRETIEDP